MSPDDRRPRRVLFFGRLCSLLVSNGKQLSSRHETFITHCNSYGIILLNFRQNDLQAYSQDHWTKHDCARIAQTSAKSSNVDQSFPFPISGLIRIREMSAGSLAKCLDLSCQRHFAECRENLIFRNGEGSGNVIRNPYPGPDHHQKLISSSDW